MATEISDRLQLPDVTLVMVTTVAHELSAMAVRVCTDYADFGDVLVLTDDPLPFGLLPRFVTIASIRSMAGADRCLWHEVPSRVNTTHVLVVQWDSGIIDPSVWSDEFLQYDYIGAPWGWYGDEHEVGNGGFSLRSKRLMQYVAEREALYPIGHPEDVALCRHYRPALEVVGFKWPPLAVASRFSLERRTIAGCTKHFGYHGIFNWPRLFQDDALEERALLAVVDTYVRSRPEWPEVSETLGRCANLHSS
jgi:hypothetical protein